MACWLFKSEPDEYGIDDLDAAPGRRARWDGIRNYQARNFLRDEVKAGDRVLFYHSSCRHTGVAGVCLVVSDPYPDPSQFDPGSPFHDGRATADAPRWYSVDIQLETIFAEILPPAKLKEEPDLADMVLFRNPRLSVQPVSDRELRTILDLANCQADGSG